MEQEARFWADDASDDSSVLSLQDEVLEHLAEGTGHIYSMPIAVGEITILTQGDFAAHMGEVYEIFQDSVPEECAEQLWSEIVRDMMDTSNPDGMDAAAFELIMMLDTSNMQLCAPTLMALEPMEVAEVEFAMTEETEDMLSDAVREMSLDVFDKTPSNTYFRAIKHLPTVNVINNLSASPLGPPMCPMKTSAHAKILRFCADMQAIESVFEGRCEWASFLGSELPDFPEDKMDTYQDLATACTSRSNTRPRNYGSVVVVFDDGTLLNVGSHGYTLPEDIDLELDFWGMKTAVLELFSAPGGEGLTCPTPSHILHQLVSACFGVALTKYLPVIEQKNVDLCLEYVPSSDLESVNIDFTTSAGIWNKKMEPDRQNPEFRYQAAISKYDLAAILISETEGDVRNLIAKSVAVCLACEYPAYYRIDEANVPQDLKIQSQIYSLISSLSQKTKQALAGMCYDASIMEGLRTIDGLDIHQQGRPWRDKRDVVRRKIKTLKPRSNIAFPPLPLGEIVPLPVDNFSITIGAHDFVAGPYIMQGRGQGPSYEMEGVDTFIKRFPASGIITFEHAKEVAKILDDTPLSCSGLTHDGPVRSFKGADDIYSTAANDAYSRSANAQLAEIRADITRAVYRLPMPKANVWSQIYVYKGKVSVWYRCRDAPNSPEGYRIDWFAVSAFAVAGASKTVTNQGFEVYLWPRQRMRSQEMDLIHNAPRRLKAVLFSMLEKARTARTSINEVYSAWERLATTVNSSTYASGKMFLTCRFLSSTLSSPSSPFDEMAKKLEAPVTYADVAYLMRLDKILSSWGVRDQYSGRAALLGLPRAFSQLESYWMMWVPSQFADSSKSFSDCIIALHNEAKFLDDTAIMRVPDLLSQTELLQSKKITIDDLRVSLRATCNLGTDGKMGWSWIGSLAAGFALNTRGNAAAFDRRYGRGTTARTIVNHFTVRHSARINDDKKIEKGTVAEMMLSQGIDDFLSTISQTYRFLFVNIPCFFNHPKKGEHKVREISITDPDSRVCLSDAELICGLYGKTTHVDFLKDTNKNGKFYRTSARILTSGGGIQSSDATRYGPSMSNFAIAIMLLYLGTLSMHLKWASVVYARLAYRRMLVSKSIIPDLQKKCAHADTYDDANSTLLWMEQMPVACYEAATPVVWYTTSHHMGQGMSHHSSSLLHAGGLIMTTNAAKLCQIVVNGKRAKMIDHIMVTSDDSTILAESQALDTSYHLTRSDKQISARIFLQLVRNIRKVCLRSISVTPNLVKEIISAVKGEFNSQDTGIGETCPILGFRELVSLIVIPSAPSLVGDYLNTFAVSRDIALAGQGLSTASYVQCIMIDSIEERWSLNSAEKERIRSLHILPQQITQGCAPSELVGSPAAFLSPALRAVMLQEAKEANADKEDLDPNTRDSVFSSLMHVKVAMSKQHRNAIRLLKAKAQALNLLGHHHQEKMILETLSSTIASAKSRNLGRVAFRIRNRLVVPRKYRDVTFDKNTMIESTLNWLDYLERKLVGMRAAPEDIRKGNSVAGFINIVSSQRAAYPRPPRLRRHQSHVPKKPRFMLSTYGATPFGVHAVKRAGVSLVQTIGYAERMAIQDYLALKRHRQFSEHVEYGGGFVTSWSDMSCGVIVALDITNGLSSQMTEHIKRGDFSAGGIARLKQLSTEYPDLPVLALHSHDGIRGLWHAIHNGFAYTVLSDYDLNLQDSDAILHQTETGNYVVLAIQGFEDSFEWSDTVPNPGEVSDYQHSDYYDPMPTLVRTVEDENIVRGNVECATYATVLDYMDVSTLVYIAPNILTTPRDNPGLLQRLPYLRGKVIAGLSAAGYWQTSLRGVAFRAYMRGCFHDQTIWTGSVIGWRLSSTNVPSYHSAVHKATSVRGLIVLGGYDDVDQVSRFNPDMYSAGYKVVCQSNTVTYSQTIRVDASFTDDIINANRGNRYSTGDGSGAFLQFDVGPAPQPRRLAMPDMARRSIINKMRGQGSDEGW